jgi:hypothetical protein
MTDKLYEAPINYDFVFLRQLDEMRHMKERLEKINCILRGYLDMEIVGTRESINDDAHNAHIYGARMKRACLLIESSYNDTIMMIDEIEKQLGYNHGLVGPV